MGEKTPCPRFVAQKYGEEYQAVAMIRTNLGILLQEIGEYPEAEKEYQTSLSIKIKVYGEAHHEVAITRGNEAVLHIEQVLADTSLSLEEKKRKLTEPKQIFETVAQRFLTADEEETFTSSIYRIFLGRICIAENNVMEANIELAHADGYFTEHYKDKPTNYGALLLQAQGNLSKVQGNVDEAQTSLEQSLVMYNTVYSNRPTVATANVQYDLGDTHLAQNNKEKARGHYTKALEMYKELKLAGDHLHIIRATNALSLVEDNM